MSPFPPIPFRSHGLPHLYNNVVTIGNRWPQEPLPVFWPGVSRPPRGPEATTGAAWALRGSTGVPADCFPSVPCRGIPPSPGVSVLAPFVHLRFGGEHEVSELSSEALAWHSWVAQGCLPLPQWLCLLRCLASQPLRWFLTHTWPGELLAWTAHYAWM